MNNENRNIFVTPLTVKKFEEFGDVIEVGTVEPKLINEDKCRRYNDLAKTDFVNGKTGISIFHSDLRSIPYELGLMERHPLGSQAFIPMGQSSYLITVALDNNGKPNTPRAFIASPNQGINIHRNVWHGVLTPISGSGQFTVIDRIGEGNNLDEHYFEKPYFVIKT